VDAYKRAIRRIDGPAVGQAEAELLRRLDEPPPGARGRARSDRMLVAWGLGLVGSREALPSLDVAAGDADPHVAALAARSAALIRARLATEESAARLP
jgi:HEAT repeat protein